MHEKCLKTCKNQRSTQKAIFPGLRCGSITYTPQLVSVQEEKTASTLVWVQSAWDYPNYLHSLLVVATHLKDVKEVVWQNCGNNGKMWQLVIKNRRRMVPKHYKATESCLCNNVPLL